MLVSVLPQLANIQKNTKLLTDVFGLVLWHCALHQYPGLCSLEQGLWKGGESAESDSGTRVFAKSDSGTQYFWAHLLVPSVSCQRHSGSPKPWFLEAEWFSATTAGTDFFTSYPRTKQPSPGPYQSHPLVKWLCERGPKSRGNLDTIPVLM